MIIAKNKYASLLNKISCSYKTDCIDLIECEENGIRCTDGSMVFAIETPLTEDMLKNEGYLEKSNGVHGQLLLNAYQLANEMNLELVIQYVMQRRFLKEFQSDCSEKLLNSCEELAFDSEKAVKDKLYISFRLFKKVSTENSYKIKDLFNLSKSEVLFVSIEDLELFKTKLFQRASLVHNFLSEQEIIKVISGAIEDLPSEETLKKFEPKIIKRDRGVFNRNGNQISVLYLSPNVEEISLGTMPTLLRTMSKLEFDYVVCITDPLFESNSEIKAKKGWYEKRDERRYLDISSISENIGRRNPLLRVSSRIVIKNCTPELMYQIRDFSLGLIGASFELEGQVPLHMLSTSLLGNMNISDNKAIERSKRMLLNSLTKMLPVYCGTSGYEEGITKISLDGTLLKIDRVGGSGNRMTTILGNSGVGKSVLVSEIILEYLEKNPKGCVRVVDHKTSMKDLVDYKDGTLRDLDDSLTSKIGFSPFAVNDPDEGDITSISVLAMTAMKSISSEIRFSALHKELLRESIRIAFLNQNHSNKNAPHPIWEDVIVSFPSAKQAFLSHGHDDHKLDECFQELRSYSVCLEAGGQFARIFSNYDNETVISDSLCVYDLDGITDDSTRLISYMTTFVKIKRDIKRLPLNIPKLVIFDEFGILVSQNSAKEEIKEFVDDIVKTCRKLNVQAIAIANDISTFADSLAGRSFWDIAKIKLFLPLGDLYPTLINKLGSYFDEVDKEAINILELEKENRRTMIYQIDKRDSDHEPIKTLYYSHMSKELETVCSTDPGRISEVIKYQGEGFENVVH
ncbi:MAG: hypothetical protein COV57_03065 [Candidatus Liptonbacteria bacterium CG11_big_fil_rev_8_21_14_0_20_35_14]|uniref:TraG P-loop domain-containing protein n=1 Tax=Candidatus Liptonbacteria bacterium CG11_big_fil_rev_8_21_14_0_20_35_14 TaxID=1974634 RepID=A0A2H0N988_9BACT|nr:MAG: hypothetical protein COV57_03065 [Candidatus Liptonbacteria bacterium CG11_big_fil_rev_8_21_14_0_20_35_14]